MIRWPFDVNWDAKPKSFMIGLTHAANRFNPKPPFMDTDRSSL